MAVTTHHTLPLVLLCIITIILYTDHTTCNPIKRSTIDESVTPDPALPPQVIDLLQNFASTHQNVTAAASTAFNVLPAIFNLLEEDKNLQTSQNHLMEKSSETINLNLVDLVNLMKTQQNMQQRQTELLENTVSSLQQMTTLLQDLPPPLNNMVQIQQDMQQQLTNITYLLHPRNTTSLPSDDPIGEQTISPVNIKMTTLPPHEATSKSSDGSSGSLSGQQTLSTMTILQPDKATSLPVYGSPSPSNGQQTTSPPDPSSLPSDCSGASSTGMQIIPVSNKLGLLNHRLDVYCDMETDGGGWIVFQRRFDGSVDFDRNWVDYERGFGSLDGEFWIGLNQLHLLTSRGRWEIRADMSDFNGNTAYAHYDNFKVGNSSSFYKLTLGSYSGTAGDGMRVQDLNGMAFSTKDQHHDLTLSGFIKCAILFKSGWWFNFCSYVNPNGKYLGRNQVKREGMTWYEWKYSWEVLKTFELKIRLVNETLQPLTTTPLPSSGLRCPSDELQTLPPYDASSLPSDCAGALSTGMQTISPLNNELGLFNVYCDMETDGGGWIVFQHRFDGSVDFYRNWEDYECGFGSLDGEFWIGLNKLHVLTSLGRWELRADLMDFDGNRVYAHYDNFKVGNSSSFYRLTVGDYSGTAGDGMKGTGGPTSITQDLNGMPFTTKDHDRDQYITDNCAVERRSGWWHRYCTFANPNGLYRGPNEYQLNSMSWYRWKSETLKETELKIRLVDGLQ